MPRPKRRICDRRRGGRCTFTGRIDVDPSLGDIGKKIHSGRSRNDQVLLDLKLFTRTQIKEVAEAVEQLFHVLIRQSERYKNVLMPGYTHLQIAMPSSFGLWFGAYAESLMDDMLFCRQHLKCAIVIH